ncbi:MAG: S41 family peptidase [Gammaproteobacteria bacterium]|nr:S41 family peptidase [Gammaproteobacteria bacterium]
MRSSSVIAITLLLALGGVAAGPAHATAQEDKPGDAARAEALPLEELRTFTEVFAKIKNDYVEQVSDKQLLESAIKGMLSGLDPHSAYLDPEAFKGLQEGTTGEFGGLGIEVGMEDGFVKVISPIDDTPAQSAGVKAGDLIIRLDDTPVKGMSLNDAVKLMRGKPGSRILLTIVREGEEQPLKLELTRAVIRVQSVKSRILDPGFGYLRISHFQSHTGTDALAALNKLQLDNGGALKALVLDLRNNPGGILSAAVDVADAFLTDGLIVYTEGRVDDAELAFSAKGKDELGGAPLVVLVNGGSASASEIVAGALQDRRRAVIMGSQTFGKGSVQTILPMNNDAALKLTTARYYTPSGRSIQAEGIKPDIVLDHVKIAKIERADPDLVKESHLSGHLVNGDGKDGATAIDAGGPPEAPGPGAPDPGLAESDYELYEALNLLKGLVLLQARN